jgi:hypothetical protein
MTTTIRNTNIETIDRNSVNIAGQVVPVTWHADGAHVSVQEIAAIRDEANANWSDQEMSDLAYHAETRMDETYTKAYQIAVAKEDGSWDILADIRAEHDAAANAIADQHYANEEWYVLDANGDNING